MRSTSSARLAGPLGSATRWAELGQPEDRRQWPVLPSCAHGSATGSHLELAVIRQLTQPVGQVHRHREAPGGMGRVAPVVIVLPKQQRGFVPITLKERIFDLAVRGVTRSCRHAVEQLVPDVEVCSDTHVTDSRSRGRHCLGPIRIRPSQHDHPADVERPVATAAHAVDMGRADRQSLLRMLERSRRPPQRLVVPAAGPRADYRPGGMTGLQDAVGLNLLGMEG